MSESVNSDDMPTIDDAAEPRADRGAGEAFPTIEGYEVIGRLGEGGMAVVYRATQLSTRREVALKLLPAGAFASEKARGRFEREVELAARLEHPNIARVYDSGLHRRVYFYAMELIEGLPMDEYVRRNQLGEREILELMRKACRAVQHAHQHGVIHRDLKPSNILVTWDGEPCVLDFGLAKTFIVGEGEKNVTMTQDGETAGTPAFMSPEQAAGRVDELDTRTDVYSLGVILYDLLTGENPHDLAGTQYEVFRRVVEQEPRRPREVNPKIGGELESVLLKALEREPDDRYASAGDLAGDLANYMSGDPVAARKATTVYFLRKRLRKYRVPVALAAVVLAALIGMVIFSYVRITHEYKQAVAAREAEAEQRERADLSAALAERKAAEAERALYFNRIGLAEAEYEQTNIPKVADLLALCPKPLRGWEWQRLNYLRDLSIRRWEADQKLGQIYAVAFSADGTRGAAAYTGKTVAVWRLSDGKRLFALAGHGDIVTSVAFSADGKWLASGCADRKIRLFHAADGRPAGELIGHEAAVNCVAFGSNSEYLFSAGDDGTVRQWLLTERKQTRVFRGHTGSVNAVAVSADGRHIASGGEDKTVRLWSAASGHLLETLTGQKELIHTLTGHEGLIHHAAFSPDGALLATASADQTVRLWSVADGRAGKVLRGHTGRVSAVGFAGGGRWIVSGGWDRELRLWDATTGRLETVLRGHRQAISSVAVAPAGTGLLSAAYAGTVKQWDLRRRREPRRLTGHTGFVLAAAFVRRGGGGVLSGSADRTFRLWDSNTGRTVSTLGGYAGTIAAIACSADGKYTVTGGSDGVVRQWRAGGKTPHRELTGHKGVVRSVAISPDGRRIVSGGDDGTVRIWDGPTGGGLFTLRHETGGVRCVAVHPAGGRVLSAGEDGTLRLWDARDGELRLTMTGHAGKVFSAAFSADGRWIGSAGADGTVRLWRSGDGKCVHVCRGHAGPVYAIAYCANGEPRFVSGGHDGTVRLWDLRSGTQAMTFRAAGGVMCLDVSGDGRQILAAGAENVIEIWDSTKGDRE